MLKLPTAALLSWNYDVKAPTVETYQACICAAPYAGGAHDHLVE